MQSAIDKSVAAMLDAKLRLVQQGAAVKEWIDEMMKAETEESSLRENFKKEAQSQHKAFEDTLKPLQEKINRENQNLAFKWKMPLAGMMHYSE